MMIDQVSRFGDSQSGNMMANVIMRNPVLAKRPCCGVTEGMGR